MIKKILEKNKTKRLNTKQKRLNNIYNENSSISKEKGGGEGVHKKNQTSEHVHQAKKTHAMCMYPSFFFV